MITRKETLLKALKDGDRLEDLVCFFQAVPDGVAPLYNDPAYEELGPVTRCTFEELPDTPFDDDYGGGGGVPCIAFSERYVYVCVNYDGSEWMKAVPRHPDRVEAPIPTFGSH